VIFDRTLNFRNIHQMCWQGVADGKENTVVGVSLELGTTKVDHVVLGTSVLAPSFENHKNNSSNGTKLSRGHVIVSVNGVPVDEKNIAQCLSSGPVGSRVLVRARDEFKAEFDVEFIRQYAPFGNFFCKCRQQSMEPSHRIRT
jgi:hypothetical protein